MSYESVIWQAMPVYGDGGNMRDWLYVGDHCTALRTVLERGRGGENYNIGGNSERRNLDVVKTICNILDDLRPDASIGPRTELIVSKRNPPCQSPTTPSPGFISTTEMWLRLHPA